MGEGIHAIVKHRFENKGQCHIGILEELRDNTAEERTIHGTWYTSYFLGIKLFCFST